METPLISIVMVNYNQEDYLKESIDSVIAQTYQNWELIIVDDGSTDASVEIIKSYEDSRIHPIFLKKNRHICYATNLGLSHICGEYVARLDSDDVWCEKKLEKQMNFFENHPKAEVCFTKLDLIDEHGNNVNKKLPDLYALYNTRQKDRKSWIRFFFFLGNSLIQSTMMFKKRLWEEVGGFNLSYMQTHDFDFFIRLIKKTDFYFLEEPLIKYRRTESQNSSLHPEKDRRLFNEYMNIRFHFFEEFPRDLFIETFQKYFVNKESYSEDELKCEQAFLLLKCIGWSEVNPVLGMMAFEQLFKEEKMVRLLEERYNFTPKDYYEINGRKQFYSLELKKDIEEKQEEIARLKKENADQRAHIEALLRLKDDQQNHIKKIENSMSWKVTEPLRNVKKILSRH